MVNVINPKEINIGKIGITRWRKSKRGNKSLIGRVRRIIVTLEIGRGKWDKETKGRNWEIESWEREDNGERERKGNFIRESRLRFEVWGANCL